ncbi:MBL fold metallo-hydrolase [Sulfurimonas sp. C5]|uniref:MBL fold metallo-hydrolase n=1 Tax=Sulfurimonas sp. C5 TaxID=3036947 RepID=UPI002457EBEE|nr:MBL fold metallo-hydrolase [Sulfurimonas sp. C5]MDH4944664.1 MBL fold metallo-hydrolase [Sulfurimonas sp. C5]
MRETFKDEYKYEEEKILQTRNIKVLGAYGTKAKGFGTTSFSLNKTDVIDAGNLLESLGEESIHVKNIWLTHQHLDHIVDIAYIIDNYFGIRKDTINILGTKGTIDAIKKHFLNDEVWPDFSKIQLPNNEMVVKYTEIELDKEYQISQNESIKAFKTDHTDSSCGYIYKRGDGAILITADTCNIDNAILEIEKDTTIKSVVIECSFPNHLEELAKNSKHLTPKMLFEQLKTVKRKDFQLYINHIKPSFILEIAQEIEEYEGDYEPILVKDGEILQF